MDFEDTVSVPRNSVEDDQYGLYTPLMSSMGVEGGDEALWIERALAALNANGNWVDGKPFFFATRKYDKQAINNTTNVALSSDALTAAIAAMQNYKGPEGLPLNVVPVYLVVNPANRTAAWNLVKNTLQPQKAVTGDTAGAATQNPLLGQALLRTHPSVTGNNWFLLGVKAGIKPVCVQKRREAALVALDRPNDQNVFWQKEFVYGADARGEAFLSLPHLAYGGLVA